MDTPDLAPETEGRASVTAPRVEIVVVAHEPGSWFDETLASIAGQDYPRFGVTLLVTSDDEDLRETIATVLPDATIRDVDPAGGFGAAANAMLDGDGAPAFYLFCHDDVALAADALRLLVEEAIRSNASVAGPKMVRWDRPEVLLEVGLDVDKLGHAVSKVEPGELDQEQHDGVADVFAIPGGVQLIRGDLFEALDGFDGDMGVTGEDVDFCWRAHVSGARVMIVPSAVVRHREAMTGRRPSAAIERLNERHRVRTLLSVYGVVHSLRVIPQGIVYSLIRFLGASVTGQFSTAGAALGAWTWNLRRPVSLLRRRGRLRQTRKVPDSEIRPLQVGGFAPVSRYLRGQLGEERGGSIGGRVRNLLNSLRSGPSRFSIAFWVLTAVVLVFGSRHLITRRVPAFGDLVPFETGPADLLARWFDSWSSVGTGHEAAAPTAVGLVGVLGLIFFGAMGLLRTVLTVGMLPIGAIGMWRFLHPFSSPWIRVVGTLMYAVSPVPYNALGNGSWSALLMFGLLPWVLAGLGRAGRLAPFGRTGGHVGEGVLEPSLSREMLALGLVMGLIVAFVPFAAVIVIAMAVALIVGSVLAGWPGGSARLVLVTAGASVVTAALNLPWLIDGLTGDPTWDWFGGTRPHDPATPDLWSLLRLDTGELGGGILGWALPVAAVVPLLLARGPRWAWAVRGLSLYVASVAAVWAIGRGWAPLSAPRPEVILAVGGLGLATSAAMGVAAIERDLRTYRFGWRQLVPITAVSAVVLAMLPATAAAFNGAWSTPGQDFNRQLAVQDGERTDTRVLWIGHDDVLAAGGREFGDGLTVAVTASREVRFIDRWGGAAQPADDLIVEALRLAIEGGTSRLGRLLAPFAIGEIIILEQAAPAPSPAVVHDVADTIAAALTEQLDLAQVEVGPGITRYRNEAALGVAALVPDGSLAGRSLRSFAGSRVELPAESLAGNETRSSFTGSVTGAQEVYLAVPASDRWTFEVDGREVDPVRALEWADAFAPVVDGRAVLEHRTPVLHRIVMAGQALLWLLAVVVVLRLSSRARAHA